MRFNRIVFIFFYFFTNITFVFSQKEAIIFKENIAYDEDWKEVFRLPEGHKFSTESEKIRGLQVHLPQMKEEVNSEAICVEDAENRYYAVNKFGKKIADFDSKYYYVSAFYNNIALAYRPMEDRKSAYMLSYVNPQGKVLCGGKEYWEASFFQGGMAKVQLDDEKGEWGYVDESGEIKIKLFAFSDGNKKTGYFGDFYKGRSILVEQSREDLTKPIFQQNYYLIDKTGKKILHFEEKFPQLNNPSLQSKEGGNDTKNISFDATSRVYKLLYNKGNTDNNDTEMLFLDENLNELGKIDWTQQLRQKNEPYWSNYFHLENRIVVKDYTYHKQYDNRDSVAFFDLAGKLIFTTSQYRGTALSEKYFLLSKLDMLHHSEVDSSLIYDVKQQKIILTLPAVRIRIENNRFVSSHKKIDSNKSAFYPITYWNDIEKVFDLKGNLISETPQEQRSYYFLRQDNLSDFDPINMLEVYRGVFRLKPIDYIKYFKNLRELELICEEETEISEDLGTLRHLEKLEINNFDRYDPKLLPESFKELRKLKELTLSGGRYDNLIECLKVLPNLKVLTIEVAYSLAKHPDYLSYLESLPEMLPHVKVNFERAGPFAN